MFCESSLFGHGELATRRLLGFYLSVCLVVSLLELLWLVCGGGRRLLIGGYQGLLLNCTGHRSHLYIRGLLRVRVKGKWCSFILHATNLSVPCLLELYLDVIGDVSFSGRRQFGQLLEYSLVQYLKVEPQEELEVSLRQFVYDLLW